MAYVYVACTVHATILSTDSKLMLAVLCLALCKQKYWNGERYHGSFVMGCWGGRGIKVLSDGVRKPKSNSLSPSGHT